MKKHIAIIAGGDSSEHEVSLRSAAGIYSFLDKERYEVHIVRVRGRQWEAAVEEGVLVPIDKNDFSYTYQGEKLRPTARPVMKKTSEVAQCRIERGANGDLLVESGRDD